MFALHLLFGLLVVYLTSMPLAPVIVAAYLPDLVDKPLSLLGMTNGRDWPHSLLILAPFAVWLAVERKNRLALVILLMVAGHLAIDLLDEPGIPLLYPFGGYVGTNLFEGTNVYIGHMLSGSGAWVQTSESVWIAEALSLLGCVPLTYLIVRRGKQKGTT